MALWMTLFIVVVVAGCSTVVWFIGSMPDLTPEQEAERLGALVVHDVDRERNDDDSQNDK